MQAALREVAHDPLRARVPAATLLAVCDEVQEAARLLWLGDPDRPLKPFEYVLARARVTVRVRVRVRVRVTLTRTLTLPLTLFLSLTPGTTASSSGVTTAWLQWLWPRSNETVENMSRRGQSRRIDERPSKPLVHSLR